MDIDIAPDEADFPRRGPQWLSEHLVGEFAAHRGVGSPTDDTAWEVRIAWEKELSAGGWLGLTWPREYGGRGATLAQEIVFENEYARAAAPARVNTQALELLGPMLLEFGTEEQKRRFLPRILSVDDIWGQGFSEPGAGSDIAAVSCRARLDGDQWVIDGQKVWTTFGHQADWLYVVCRTASRRVPAPQGPDDAPRAGRPARGGDPAHREPRRLGGVQRVLLHRRPDRCRPRGRGCRRRLAGGDGNPRDGARCGADPDAARHGARGPPGGRSCPRIRGDRRRPHAPAAGGRLHRDAAHAGDDPPRRLRPAARHAPRPTLRPPRASSSPRWRTNGWASSPWTSRVPPHRSCRRRFPAG